MWLKGEWVDELEKSPIVTTKQLISFMNEDLITYAFTDSGRG